MSFNVLFGYGQQRLLDAFQNYTRAAHPVYLRLRNYPNIQQNDAVQLGFAISPAGAPLGTVDIEIKPRPSYDMISMHNIGMSNGKLRFGARLFLVSATFVDNQVRQQQLTDQDLVWRGQDVVGLFTDNQVFSIEVISHQEAAGKTVSWLLTCNAVETK